MSLLMMINRIQTPQDFSDFISSNHAEIQGIVDRASNNILQIIADTLWALFMKMQVPVNEATDCVKKMIGGSQMGNWFENMEPMNIQEERAKTKQAVAELEKTEEKLDRTEEKLGKTEAELQVAQAEIEKLRAQLQLVQDKKNN